MVGSKPDLNPPPRRERASVGFAAHNLNQILYQMSHSIILEVCVDSVESARAYHPIFHQVQLKSQLVLELWKEVQTVSRFVAVWRLEGE